MESLLIEWANISSPTLNLEQLNHMREALEEAFSTLGGEMRAVDLAPIERMNLNGILEMVDVGKALTVRKRPDAPIQIFLGGHFDTVYQDPFPVEWIDKERLRGPGVTDMKGGIVVMLEALKTFDSERVGWEVLLTPDEEIGSPASSRLFPEIASRCDVGLIFESSGEDGMLVSKRPGSAVFTVVARGESAHAGFGGGKSSIRALAELVVQMKGVNVGQIQGGVAPNVVPAHAALRFNIRGETIDLTPIHRIMEKIEEQYEVELSVHQESLRPPLEVNRSLLERVGLGWHESGGVCDGNNLTAAGLPTIDAMGVRGGKIHSPDEFIYVQSLAERVELTVKFLESYAS